MATPPLFVAEYEAAWTNTTSPKTVSVTMAPGDTLTVVGMTEDSTITLNTPTGGTGLTYALQTSAVLASHATAYLWTAVSGTTQTFTLSLTTAGSVGNWGFNALRYAGSGGVGNAASTTGSGGPSLNITTLRDNSVIVVASSDWAAVDGTTRTWRTTAGALTEQSYARVVNQYTIYAGFHPDAAAAGAKTVGVSAPVGQTYSIAAVEIFGAGSRISAVGVG